jgi:hypothetical protein
MGSLIVLRCLETTRSLLGMHILELDEVVLKIRIESLAFLLLLIVRVSIISE